MTNAQIIEAYFNKCDRCGTSLDDEEHSSWIISRAGNEEFEHEHHAYDMASESEHDVVTCSTCTTLLGEQHAAYMILETYD